MAISSAEGIGLVCEPVRQAFDGFPCDAFVLQQIVLRYVEVTTQLFVFFSK
jgi:hypothetical protein